MRLGRRPAVVAGSTRITGLGLLVVRQLGRDRVAEGLALGIPDPTGLLLEDVLLDGVTLLLLTLGQSSDGGCAG